VYVCFSYGDGTLAVNVDGQVLRPKYEHKELKPDEQGQVSKVSEGFDPAAAAAGADHSCMRACRRTSARGLPLT
jgi:hypothetical protein